MTDAEIACIEQDYGFEFANDHRAFLAAGLPLNRPPDPASYIDNEFSGSEWLISTDWALPPKVPFWGD